MFNFFIINFKTFKKDKFLEQNNCDSNAPRQTYKMSQ